MTATLYTEKEAISNLASYISSHEGEPWNNGSLAIWETRRRVTKRATLNIYKVMYIDSPQTPHWQESHALPFLDKLTHNGDD